MQQMEFLKGPQMIKIGPPEMPNGDLCWIREFFGLSQSDDLFQALLAMAQWRQNAIKRGRKVTQLPRLTAWYGNSGKTILILEFT